MHAEQEMIERLLMTRAEIQEPRVRGDIKRRFTQLIVLEIHTGIIQSRCYAVTFLYSTAPSRYHDGPW